MTNTEIPALNRASLPPDSAFVVHLTAIAAEAPESVSGRVEHITSGSAARFGSVAELLRFMRQTVGLLLLLVAIASPAWSTPDDTCITGSNPVTGTDTVQIATLRDVIDAACPCASFDGSEGKTRRDYRSCVAPLIKQAVKAGDLRPKCKGVVSKADKLSTCGLAESLAAVPCIEIKASGKIGCRILTTDKCISDGRTTRASCAGFERCVDAADDNGDYVVDSADSAVCLFSTPTPTASATATLEDTATATAVPTHTPTETPVPTSTPPETPTDTPVPTSTPTETPTDTPAPTNTPLPTDTPSPGPTSTPTTEPEWTFCGLEGGTCVLPGHRKVRFGADGIYTYPTFIIGTSIPCTSLLFGSLLPDGDLLPGATVRHCEYSAATEDTNQVPFLPRIQVDADADLQIPLVPPTDNPFIPEGHESGRCAPQSVLGGGCPIFALDGLTSHVFDARASFDNTREGPGDPEPSYHWEIFKPSFLNSTRYTNAGISGYHGPVLTLQPNSLPALQGLARDVQYHVRLTITSNVTHETFAIVYFRFDYLQSNLGLTVSSDCQTREQPVGPECYIGDTNVGPATEPT